MLCGSPDGRRVWERMDTCISLAKSLCCPLETITVLLTDYTPIQDKNLGKKKKEATCAQGLPRGSSFWVLHRRVLRALEQVQFSSVAQLCLTLRPHEPQHARPPCLSPTPGVHPNSCPLSQ